jgi:hypothetical protein
MKTLLIAFVAAIATTNLFAQGSVLGPEQTNAAVQTEQTQRDGLTLKEGKVYMTENGITKVITEEIWTKRGMQITPSGTLIFENGEKAKLLEGDFATMDGVVERPISLDAIGSEVAYNKK